MIGLSKNTIQIIDTLFRQEQRPYVYELLRTECAETLPSCENYDQHEMERIRFSVLKLSEGQIEKLAQAIELAQIDCRDLFVNAGFDHAPEAHKGWVP